MVKMHSNGITIEVPESEVSFYLRAGYKVVDEPKDEPKQEEKPKRGK